MKNIFRIENKIYIISEEKIQEGDWYYLLKENKIAKCPKILNLFSVTPEWTQKIVITTDVDLVADGIQFIDYKSLKWLAENPNCEYVKVIEIFDNVYVGGFLATETKVGYEIIIPKDRTTTPEIKKETIEEATETELYLTINKTIDGGKNLSKGYNVTRGQAIDYAFDIAVEVAKKMYSDKEVIQLLIKFNQEIREVEDVRGWFERFKKEITL